MPSGLTGCLIASLMTTLLTLVASVQLTFQMHGVAGHTKTENPEHQGREHITFGGHAQPFRVGGGLLDAVEQVEQADDDHQACVLEQRNEGVEIGRASCRERV